MRSLVTVCKDAYSALRDAHALVVCTEWDEFKVIILLKGFTKMGMNDYHSQAANIPISAIKTNPKIVSRASLTLTLDFW